MLEGGHEEGGEGEEEEEGEGSREYRWSKASRWWLSHVTQEDLESIASSNKLKIMFEILDKCSEIDDKCLIFSSYTTLLDTVEHFMKKRQPKEYSPYNNTWTKGLDYLRLDGNTPTSKRDDLFKQFNNDKNKRLRVFLKAGAEGITLTGANRVIILDVSWNPTLDGKYEHLFKHSTLTITQQLIRNGMLWRLHYSILMYNFIPFINFINFLQNKVFLELFGWANAKKLSFIVSWQRAPWKTRCINVPLQNRHSAFVCLRQSKWTVLSRRPICRNYTSKFRLKYLKCIN